MEEKRKPVIQVRNLHKVYSIGKNRVHALNGVSLDIFSGENIQIMEDMFPEYFQV